MNISCVTCSCSENYRINNVTNEYYKGIYIVVYYTKLCDITLVASGAVIILSRTSWQGELRWICVISGNCNTTYQCTNNTCILHDSVMTLYLILEDDKMWSKITFICQKVQRMAMELIGKKNKERKQMFNIFFIRLRTQKVKIYDTLWCLGQIFLLAQRNWRWGLIWHLSNEFFLSKFVVIFEIYEA